MKNAAFAAIALLASCSQLETDELETLEVGQPAPVGGPRCMLGAPSPNGTPVVLPAGPMLQVVQLLEGWAFNQACNAGDPNQKNLRDVICNFAVAPPATPARATGVSVWGQSSTLVSTKDTLEVYNGTTLVDSETREHPPSDPNNNSDMNFYNCDYNCSNADPANPNAGTVLLSAAPFHSAVIKGNGGQDYLPPDGTGAAFCGQLQTAIKNANLDCEIGPGAQVWTALLKSLRDPKWVDTKKPAEATITCFPEEPGKSCPWFRAWKDAHPNTAITSAVIVSKGTTWERDAAKMTANCQAEYNAVPAATRDAACAGAFQAPGAAKPSIYAVEVSGRFVCTKAMQPGGGGQMIDGI